MADGFFVLKQFGFLAWKTKSFQKYSETCHATILNSTRMMKTLQAAFILFFCSANFLFAQFHYQDSFFQPTGVANNGLVAGYEMQAGPYRIWNPDSGNTYDIGGLAPGNGVGGQARFSTDGNYLSGTSMGLNGAEMSIFNRNTGTWILAGSLGFMVDSTVSGGYTISGDGNTVAGNSWADTTGGLAFTHGIAFNANGGVMDLGTLFPGRSTRVNAANEDGSVLVGWQDFNGPWKSAVWRKNQAGGYYPNAYILIDTTGNPNDEYNQMGECSAVSADGSWIGGYGDYANNNQPWIWNADSGVINLGSLPNTGNGYVAGMNSDASVVVGWFDGMLWGDPQTPFIWRHAGGLQELNVYINNALGYATGTRKISGASCISSNGHYVCGYGIDTATFNPFAFCVNMWPTSVGESKNSSALKIYPNPSSDVITLENYGSAFIELRSADGKLLHASEMKNKITLDLSSFAKGVYLISLRSHSGVQVRKVIKN